MESQRFSTAEIALQKYITKLMLNMH